VASPQTAAIVIQRVHRKRHLRRKALLLQKLPLDLATRCVSMMQAQIDREIEAEATYHGSISAVVMGRFYGEGRTLHEAPPSLSDSFQLAADHLTSLSQAQVVRLIGTAMTLKRYRGALAENPELGPAIRHFLLNAQERFPDVCSASGFQEGDVLSFSRVGGAAGQYFIRCQF
jgi:hypothetical protein